MKGDDIKYCEGSIVSIGHPRMNMQEMKPGQMQMPSMQQVVDVTYSLDGKNYTDAVDVTACMFPSKQPGVLTLLSTDKDAIVRELHATLKSSENYIKEAEKEVPKQEKRIKQCKELVSMLDTEFKERQENEQRFVKLEETQRQQGTKLDEILSLLKARP
jgi:hypothetical protein